MIYILIENTKYGVNIRAFETNKLREEAVKELLKEYSTEYNKKIKTIDELQEITMDNVWIDLFNTEVEK